MLLSVVETHRQGVRLSRDEIRTAEPVVGQLVINDWREGCSVGRALRVAYLKHPTISYHPHLLHPLFEPVIVRMTSTGFLLTGMQICVVGQTEPVEVAQGWWVRFSSP